MRASIRLFDYRANYFKILVDSIAEQLDTPRQNRLIHNKMAYEHTVSKIRNILLANQLFANEAKLISKKQTELAVNNERFLFDVYVGKAVSANHIHQEPITRLYCDGQDTIEEMNITTTLATARGLAFSHHQNLNELLAKSPTKILRDLAKEIAFGYAMCADYKSAQHYMQKFHIEAKEIEKLFLSTNDQQAAQRFKNHLEKSSINTDQKASYAIVEVENIASNICFRR